VTRTWVICPNCEAIEDVGEHVNIGHIINAGNADDDTVYNRLEASMHPDRHEDRTCQSCGKKGSWQQGLHILQPPGLLFIICQPRYVMRGQAKPGKMKRARPVKSFVQPNLWLQVGQWLPKEVRESKQLKDCPLKYKLTGVIYRAGGSTDGGHFTSAFKNPNPNASGSDLWHYSDFADCHEIPMGDIMRHSIPLEGKTGNSQRSWPYICVYELAKPRKKQKGEKKMTPRERDRAEAQKTQE
jgi:uncharacterized UBP type Zn finger protein